MEVQANASEVKPSQSEQTETQKETKSSVEERLAQLEATNKRLLEESKINKKKYQEEKDKNEQFEVKTLTEKEDYKKLLEKATKRAQELEQKVSGYKVKNLEKTLNYEVSRYAQDAYDLELVKQALPRELIDAVEDNDDIQVMGVKEAIEKVKSEKPFLFKPKTIPGMASAKPAAQTTGSTADLNKMSPQQLANILAGRKL